MVRKHFYRNDSASSFLEIDKVKNLCDPNTALAFADPLMRYRCESSFSRTDKDEDLSRNVWLHALAILYTPSYLAEHDDAMRADWPRVPLPATLKALQDSAKLGADVGRLLDIEKPALGVITGKLRKELIRLGKITGPQKGLSLGITAKWGYIQKVFLHQPAPIWPRSHKQIPSTWGRPMARSRTGFHDSTNAQNCGTWPGRLPPCVRCTTAIAAVCRSSRP